MTAALKSLQTARANLLRVRYSYRLGTNKALKSVDQAIQEAHLEISQPAGQTHANTPDSAMPIDVAAQKGGIDPANDPQLSAAMQALQSAATDLQHNGPGYGEHRVGALRATRWAIRDIEKTLESYRIHPPRRPA